MGAKTSTPATSGHQSPRSRTFSSSSTSATDIVPPGVEATNHGLNLLRTLPGLHVQQQAAHQHQQQQLQQQQQQQQQQHTLTSTIDRQRARSLSSVPDIHQQQGSQQPHSSSHACSPGSANVGQNHLTRNINHFALGANNNNNNNQAHHHSQIAATYSSPAGSSNGSNNLMQHRHALNDVSAMVAGGGFMESIALSAATSSANGIGRVYTATSLPSHIWSFNVIYYIKQCCHCFMLCAAVLLGLSLCVCVCENFGGKLFKLLLHAFLH